MKRRTQVARVRDQFLTYQLDMLFGNGLPSWAQNLYVLIGMFTVDSTAPLRHPTVRFWVGVSSVLIAVMLKYRHPYVKVVSTQKPSFYHLCSSMNEVKLKGLAGNDHVVRWWYLLSRETNFILSFYLMPLHHVSCCLLTHPHDLTWTTTISPNQL